MFDEYLLEVAEMFKILTLVPLVASDKRQRRKQYPESAVLLLPGQEELWRVTRGVRYWQFASNAKYLWVAGTRGDPAYKKKDIVACVYGNEKKPAIEMGGYCQNAKDQAIWVCDLLQRKYSTVRRIIVTTAAYHVPRCMLTLLATLDNYGFKNQLMILAIGLGGDLVSSDQILSEAKKIREYRAKGHVATAERLADYLKWYADQGE